MTTGNCDPNGTPGRFRTGAFRAVRWLGSMELAVFLLVALGVVLARATLIEAAEGREAAQWRVYRTDGFAGLLLLLAINILAATIARYPWGWRRSGFVVTHAGLLILLGGSFWTHVSGVEGQMTLSEQDAVDHISIADRCQFTIQWPQSDSAASRPPLVFAFSPGPNDWPAEKTLDLGSFAGVNLKILKYYRYAVLKERWLDDPESSDAAMRFALVSPEGQLMQEQWLVAGPFGAQARVGPIRFDLQHAPTPTFVEDFLRPPDLEDAPDGILSIHFQGNLQRVSVRDQLHQRIPLGDGQTAVEIVEYLPDAQPSEQGRFVAKSQEPLNPLVELRIHLKDRPEPLRQVAFALLPLLNLDSMQVEKCPVQFWFHHPQAPVESGVEFIQTPDGKLHGRVGHLGKRRYLGEVPANQPIDIAAGFQVVLKEHHAHARREVDFESLAAQGGGNSNAEPAMLVEFMADGSPARFWMQRNHPEFGVWATPTSREAVTVKVQSEQLPLGFSLQLLNFQRETNPGGVGDAAFASTVRLVDEAARTDEEREISMNAPLNYGGYAFYQSSFRDTPTGAAVSVLNVAYLPGRFLTYLGSGLICLGIFVMSCQKYDLKQAWLEVKHRRNGLVSAAPLSPHSTSLTPPGERAQFAATSDSANHRSG